MTHSEKIINSYNFARNSNIVFSEIVTVEQFEELNISDYVVIDRTSKYVFYKLTKFKINENNIIFSNTDTLINLFKLLKNIKGLNNIKLITNQTDTMITEYYYRQKPDCISEWYSINVDFVSDDLIPIPYGIANNYSPKNLLVNDFNETNVKKFKENLMYVNFVKNTNFTEREVLYDYFSNKDWALVEEPNLDLSDYKDRLSKYKFVLCPWGNGVDTHRIWETLYCGNIPITKKHHTFSTSLDLPILFVESYSDINLELLNYFSENLEKKNTDKNKLIIDTWFNEINKKKITEKESIHLKESKLSTFLFLFIHKSKSKILSKIKKLNYYLRKVKKLFLNF